MYLLFIIIHYKLFNITVTNAFNNHHIGSIADYDPIKKQQPYGGVKYTNSSESQNYSFGVFICIIVING